MRFAVKNAKSKNQDQSLFDDDVSAIKAESVGVTFEQIAPLRLGDFVENPDNPQTISDRAFDRLIGKLKRIPHGLMAKRIAYVTDHAAGKYVVLSGNKRLRALKQIYGDDYVPPADWFQDITSMSEDQRNEFVVNANVNDGSVDTDKLLSLYNQDELTEWVGEDRIGDLITIAETSADVQAAEAEAAADAVKLVEFKIPFSSANYKTVVEYLRKRSDDMAVAFMGVVNGRRT